ncbi:DNA primase [Candidatus Peregrinibacteria bacterium CG_4_10_14_0_2_um_filter_38_24]|nr:MAG: DNA primase [Candidatus Peregrinibacteria bacterium CG_4_10_14_0_2_um_filter_38_24]PJC38491.1 MAG: DNA primase [Candidatus Peregrinibacteria bacterium CG_4_9_14_0_2_um_filter_38_9]
MVDIVSDIKGRLDINDVVSQYVQLKRAGHNFKGLCPFHSEKTPSFVVSPEKQICHCFGCNKGGDIFGFIQEVEGVTFAEAMKILADRAGLKIENFDKVVKKEGKTEKDEYFKAHELACEFFEKQLHSTNDGKKVLDYLYSRGVKDETIKEFRIGFSPESYDALYTELLKSGVKKDVLIKSGFVSVKNISSDQIFDKFRMRLMFPIFDALGRICGFGGRALKADQMPKYLNSPENIIYSKSKVLYGFSHAKKYIKEAGNVVFVEGYFDVILPYQEGVKNIVATSGTALTKEQAKMMSRITQSAVTSFDTDSAGFEATRRAFEILQKEEFSVKTVFAFDKKDPADYVHEHGGTAFKEAVESAKDFISFYMDRLIKDFDVDTFDGRKNVMNLLMPFYKVMTPTDRDFYVKELGAKISTGEKILYDEIDSYKLPKGHPARQSFQDSLSESSASKKFEIGIQEIMLGIVLVYPHIFAEISSVLTEDDFEEDCKNVYKDCLTQYNSFRIQEGKWDFESEVLVQFKVKTGVYMLYVEDKYQDFSDVAVALEVKKLVDSMKKSRRNNLLKELQLKLKEAEKSEDRELLIKLLQEQQILLSK